jgi:predicted MFS family arabinose efflux permease
MRATSQTMEEPLPPDAPPRTDAQQRRARTAIAAVVWAEVISTAGGRMAIFGIPWLVLTTTGSPVKVGLITAAETLPYVVSGVLAAPLQDRMGARLTSIVADIASAVAMAAIILGYDISFGAFMVLVAIAGALRAQADRSKNNIFKPLVEAAGTHFGRFASIRQGAIRTSNLIGAALAGVAIAVFGAVGALWFNALTFAVSGLLVLAFVRDPDSLRASDGEAAAPEGAEAAAKAEPYVQALRNGFGSFRSDRLIGSVTGMLFFTNLFNQASVVVFVPLWILTGDHSPAVLGFISGAFAIGGILGTAIFAVLAPYVRPYQTLVLGYFIGGSPRFLILALSDDLFVVSAVMFVSGIAMCSVNPTVGAMVFQRVSGAMLARVGGIMAAVAFAGIPLGGLFAGVLVEQLSLVNAILLGTALYFMVTLTPIVRHRIWIELNDTATSGRPAGEQAALPALYALASSAMGPRISLRYVDGEWSLSARRGLRTLVPRRFVPAKQALDALNRIDCDAMHDSVRGTIQAVHARTHRDAVRLRSGLDRIHAPLGDFTLH